MGEITSLIEDVQKDKDQFAKLEQAMEPLINKYMRKLYKDDKDDVYAELILALWEAVTKLKYVENDGQCLRFLEKALQNKFYELYRSSRKKHDNQFASEMEMIDITVYEENKFIDIIIEEDLKQIVKERIEGGANEKAVLRLFINCPFVCINFDFFWLNKARQLYMDF